MTPAVVYVETVPVESEKGCRLAMVGVVGVVGVVTVVEVGAPVLQPAKTRTRERREKRRRAS